VPLFPVRGEGGQERSFPYEERNCFKSFWWGKEERKGEEDALTLALFGANGKKEERIQVRDHFAPGKTQGGGWRKGGKEVP